MIFEDDVRRLNTMKAMQMREMKMIEAAIKAKNERKKKKEELRSKALNKLELIKA